MKHLFDVDIAIKYGVNAAVLLENLSYWVKQNKANETNFHDGYYWTYNSKRAFKELFPYMSDRQIYTALNKLIEDGIVITGNYNKLAYDRTLWYTVTKKGESLLQNGIIENIKNGESIVSKCKMETCKTDNENFQNVQPIPDINTDINTDNKRDIGTRTRKTFTRPTVEEIQAYCRERNNRVDAQRFFDYYESNGWKVGKSSMKDWKASVRTWERNGYSNSNNDGSTYGANGIKIKKPNEPDDLDGIL